MQFGLLLAESYLYRLDPVAVPFSKAGDVGIRWYGLAYAAGFLIAWLFMRTLAAKRRVSFGVATAGDLMFAVVIGVLVGGRVGYAIFYDPGLLVGFSAQVPFWDLLAINKGGMASHGGILGVIVACIVFARRAGIRPLHLLDLGAFACAPGLFLGRIANFINGELWGKALPDPMQAAPPWWSIKYPEEILLTGFRHAAEVHAKLQPLVGGDEMFLENVIARAREGDEQVVGVLRPLLTAYYPSQLIQALAEGPLLMGLLFVVWLRPRRPGVVGSWFLMGYGAMRIATEVVRQPDAGVALLLGLSRGQVLSVLMIVAGAIGLALCARRDVPKSSPFVAGTAEASAPIGDEDSADAVPADRKRTGRGSGMGGR